MAQVRRAVLVDVPPTAAYRCWDSPSTYPEFMPDLAAIAETPEGWRWQPHEGRGFVFNARIAAREPGSLVAWESDDGPWRRVGVTFAEISGPSTWVTCTVEVILAADDDVTRVLARCVAMVQAWLTQFQSFVEHGETQPHPSARDAGA